MFRGYRVKDKKFSNLWLALDFAKESKSHVIFDYYNDVFCNLKGLKLNANLDYRSEYLKKLFSQEQNLLYSGGSDSHTILLESQKLGLNWNSILTLLSAPTLDGDANLEYSHGIKYCKEHNLQQTIINHDIEWYEKIYNDKEFMFKNAGEINFRPDYLQFVNEFKRQEKYISGHEKPLLIYHEKRWYAWFHDTLCIDYLDLDNITFFFTSPEMPEIYIQDCRTSRDLYVQKNGLPQNGTVVKHMAPRSELTNDQFDKSVVVTSNNKNAESVKQLWKMGRYDIIYRWLDICYTHKKTYENQLTWFSDFQHHGLISWIIDIDSLETINTSDFPTLLTK